MKTRITVSAASLLALALISSCNGTVEQTAGENVIGVNISTQLAPATRVVVNPADETKLMWEGNEQLAVLIGNNNSKTATPSSFSTQGIATVGGRPGVFSGTVDLGTFPVTDIRGIAVPYNEDVWVRYNNNLRIVVRLQPEQVQNENNVLNNRYFPLFAVVSPEDFTIEGNTYTIENKELQWSCSGLRFNIYGKFTGMADDEIFESITAVTSVNPNPVGTFEWQIAQDTMVFNGSGRNIETKLLEACTIADKNESNGIKVYMSILPREAIFSGVIVKTNKATYSKAINYTATPALKRGTLIPVNIDLSTFDSRMASVAEPYSTDGGTTWSSTMPTASDTFTSLIVKGAAITADIATALAAAVNAQASPVDLDLSQSSYAATTWPDVFRGTATNPSLGLKSIKFPANVNAIADSAFNYNSSLTTVDLTGITSIGHTAFGRCHLTQLTVPNTVTTIKNQAFRWNFYLDSVYYDSPAPTGTYILAQNDATWDQNPENKKEVIVIGPSVTVVPQHFCRSNALLNKVIFEGAPSVQGSMFTRSTWLETVEFKTATPPTYADGASNITSAPTESPIYGTGQNLSSGKKVICPKGALAAYQESSLIQELVGRGYELVEAD